MPNIERACEAMIESIEDYAIYQLDEHGNVKSWNKGAEKIVGYTRPEIIGKNFSIFFTQDDLDMSFPEKIIQQVKADGSIICKGWRVRNDGTMFWGDVVATAVTGEEGGVTAISVIVRDITKRRQQKEIDNSNLEALINNTNDLMWSVDRDYKLVMSNKPFDEMVKQMSGNVMKRGSNGLEIGLKDEDIARYRQYYDRTFAGESFTIIDHITEPFELWSEISFYPIRKGDTVIGAACHTHSITNSVLAERKITYLNRLYSFVCQINKAIVHATDEQTLFDEACRIAVTTGEFKTAWISRIDTENTSISLVSQFGLRESDLPYFTGLKFKPTHPLGLVIDSGQHYVCNYMNSGAGLGLWKRYIRSRGLGSYIILPLLCSNQVVAVFTLCKTEVDFFDTQEIDLLKEACSDLSFALDVLEKERLRKKAEEKLKHNEFRLNQAQEIAHIGSWELDFSTNLAIWSDEQCNIYGVSTADNIHSYASWLSFIHPDDLEYVLQSSKEGQASLKNYSHSYRIIRKDGAIRYLYNHNYFEFNSQGTAVSLYGTSHDITEIVKAEEQLKYSEFRLKQAQEIAHCGSWEYNFSTGIVLWSDEACRIYGLDPSENKQSYSSWLSFIHPDDVKHVLKTTKDAEASLSKASFYHRIVRRDDSIRHIHAQAHFEFDKTGKPIGLLGVAHDITDNVANISKLKVQNDLLEDIAWIQSHKVRGPLATILGLAQQFGSSESPQETEDIIQGILQSSEKLDTIIREIVQKTYVP